MANTFNDIINATYYKMSQKSTSTTYDLETLVKPKINSCIEQICRGEYTSVLDNIIYRAGKLPFLETKKEYYNKISESLTAEVSSWDTEISFDTTNYPISGAVVINGNIINYTGKTATQITWCTNVLINTESGYVRQLYPFPWDVEKPFSLKIWDYNNSVEKDFPFQEDTKSNQYGYYYSITQDTEGSNYVDIVYTKEELFWMYYNKEVTPLVDSNDLCILPVNYWLDVVAPIVAGELLRDKEQQEHASTLLNNWYKKLKDMYSYYSRSIKDTQKKVFWSKKTRLF